MHKQSEQRVKDLEKEVLERKWAEEAVRTSHKQLTTVLDSLDAIVYASDIKTYEILFVNQLAEHTFGDVVGKVCWQTLQAGQAGPCDFCSSEQLLTATDEAADVSSWECRNTVNDRWYAIRDRAISWIDGRRLARLSIHVDIDDRKRGEEALQKSEEEFREWSDTFDTFVGKFDPDGVLIFCNEPPVKAAGLTMDDVVGKYLPDTKWWSHSEVERGKIVECLQKAKKGHSSRIETNFRSADGTPVPIIFNCQPVMDEKGNAKYITAEGKAIVAEKALQMELQKEIAERKRTEEALRQARYELELRVDERTAELVAANKRLEQEIAEHKRADATVRENREKLAGILDSVAEQIIILDKQYNIVWSNKIARRFFGRDVTGEKCYAAYHGRDKVCEPCLVKETFSDGKPHECETEIVRADGKKSVLWFTSSVASRYEDGRPKSVVEASRDITARKQAEEALRGSEDRYRRITEAVTDYIFRVDVEDGKAVGTVHSSACVAVTEYTPEEFASDPYLWIKMVHEEDQAAVQEQAACILSGQETQPIEHRILRKDGVTSWVRNTLVPHYDSQGRLWSYDGLISDISEQKALEAQLQHAQKMESVGTLAGGIAHDFNNVLSAIIGYTELAKEDVAEDPRVSANLQQVLIAGGRAKDLVRQILTFSRKTECKRMPLQISPIVKEALRMLRASLPATIEIRQNIKSQPDKILVEPTQIHQVLMNLCTNAAHAMQEHGGALEVSLVDEELGADAARHHNLKSGPYVRLTVSDTGCGMGSEVMERIFDPFFTTKEPGQGTGMGLATAHGIVKNHGGAISVNSEIGKGTSFNVFFPRIEDEAEAETEVPEPLPTGNERILFVDDEEALVNMGKYMLKRLGYQVECTTSSIEALEAFGAQPHKFDLVITDMTMPNMTGTELAEGLLRMRPDTQIILCTGYSQMISEEKSKAMGIRAFVTKPMVMRELAETIRCVLDEEKET